MTVTMQTVGTYGGNGHHSDLGLVPDPAPQGQWVHTTLWQVPAHTRINVTIYHTTRAARCATSRSAWSPGPPARIATLNGKTVPHHQLQRR